jgi:hypothetical protein
MAASMKVFFALGYNYYNLSDDEVTAFQTPRARPAGMCWVCLFWEREGGAYR